MSSGSHLEVSSHLPLRKALSSGARTDETTKSPSKQKRASIPFLSSAITNKFQHKNHEKQNFTQRNKYHIVVFGASKVGKSAIVEKFFYGKIPERYEPTVEDLHSQDFIVFGKQLSISVLDTAGSHDFPAMRALNITNADGFLLVYAIDNALSWDIIKNLHDEIKSKRKEKVPTVIVANKMDLEEHREVSKVQVETVVELEWENGFIEISAKEDEDVTGVFRELLSQADIMFPLLEAVNSRRKSLSDDENSSKRRGSLALQRLKPTNTDENKTPPRKGSITTCKVQ